MAVSLLAAPSAVGICKLQAQSLRANPLARPGDIDRVSPAKEAMSCIGKHGKVRVTAALNSRATSPGMPVSFSPQDVQSTAQCSASNALAKELGVVTAIVRCGIRRQQPLPPTHMSCFLQALECCNDRRAVAAGFLGRQRSGACIRPCLNAQHFARAGLVSLPL